MRNTKRYLSLPFNPKLKQRAKELRKAGMLHEALLWNKLKRKQFKGLDFDRQKIIGNYIVDFFCGEKFVVIEADGVSHDGRECYDAKRDAYLKGLGLTVIRITAKDILQNMDGVMSGLENHPALSVERVGEIEVSGGLCVGVLGEEVPPRQASPATPPQEGNFDLRDEDLKRREGESNLRDGSLNSKSEEGEVEILSREVEVLFDVALKKGSVNSPIPPNLPVSPNSHVSSNSRASLNPPNFINSPPLEGWQAKPDGVVPHTIKKKNQ